MADFLAPEETDKTKRMRQASLREFVENRLEDEGQGGNIVNFLDIPLENHHIALPVK